MQRKSHRRRQPSRGIEGGPGRRVDAMDRRASARSVTCDCVAHRGGATNKEYAHRLCESKGLVGGFGRFHISLVAVTGDPVMVHQKTLRIRARRPAPVLDA